MKQIYLDAHLWLKQANILYHHSSNMLFSDFGKEKVIIKQGKRFVISINIDIDLIPELAIIVEVVAH